MPPVDDRRGPVRTCVGCGQRAPMGQLARTTRAADGSLTVDRVASGRGAWLCRVPGSGALRAACVDLAGRRMAFDRALRGPVSRASIEALRVTASERARMDSGAAVDAAHGRRD